MDNFNKAISFILGLVVVVVLLAVISGRINLKQLSNITRKPSTTPTPTSKTAPSPTATPYSAGATRTTPTPLAINKYQAKTPQTIPSTGSPTFLLPLIFSGLASGVYLRRKK